MNNLVVANGQFFGGGMKVAPKAAPTDGLLDIQIEHARKREAIAIDAEDLQGDARAAPRHRGGEAGEACRSSPTGRSRSRPTERSSARPRPPSRS